MTALIHTLSYGVALVLLAFTARRLLFLIAALIKPGRRRPAAGDALLGPAKNGAPGQLPHVLVLLPCRDEARSLPALLSALDRLEYPRERLTVVFLDDGSGDATPQFAGDWAASRDWAHVLSLAASVGKPAALNEGLAHFPAGELVAVYDADCLPAPDSLLILARAFDDPAVGAANGFLLARNPLATLPAYYAALEHLVHQRITTVAKDRLGLAPPILGSNCLYRRVALKSAGYFRPGLLLEDSNLTVGLALAGYSTRFVPEAVAYTSVPQTLVGYWKQHVRWARGFQQVTGLQGRAIWRDRRLPPGLRLELLAFSLGYADRLALMAGGGLTALDLLWPRLTGFPRWLWLVYFGLPFAQIAVALALSPRKAPPRMFLYLVFVPFFFAFDLAMSAWSAVQDLLRRPARWTVTERPLASSR